MTRPAAPVLVYAPSPDDPLDASTAAAMLGIHEDSAYKLAKLLPSYDAPGIGMRFRRADVLAYLYRPEHRRDPAGKCQGRAEPAPGTKRAKPRERGPELVPGTDMTQEQLEKRSGI